MVITETPVEGFVEPRGIGSKQLRTNMLSSAYGGGNRFEPTLDKMHSIVSDGAMANAGSINSIARQLNAQARSSTSSSQLVEPSASASDSQFVQDNVDVSVSNVQPTTSDTQPSNTQEGFFNTGIESVSVNAMNNLEGPTIYTNGQLSHGLTYDQITKQVKEGKHVSDHSSAGAGKGDGFQDVYDKYVKIQDQHDRNATGVRDLSEIQEITESLNGESNLAKHNLLTRAGAGRAKIVLDKNGTVGVMDDNARRLPERERNHKIYATSHVVHIPGYSLDYTDQYQNLTNGGSGFAKAMAHTADQHITGIGENAAANSKILADGPNESFSTSY